MWKLPGPDSWAEDPHSANRDPPPIPTKIVLIHFQILFLLKQVKSSNFPHCGDGEIHDGELLSTTEKIIINKVIFKQSHTQCFAPVSLAKSFKYSANSGREPG